MKRAITLNPCNLLTTCTCMITSGLCINDVFVFIHDTTRGKCVLILKTCVDVHVHTPPRKYISCRIFACMVTVQYYYNVRTLTTTRLVSSIFHAVPCSHFPPRNYWFPHGNWGAALITIWRARAQNFVLSLKSRRVSDVTSRLTRNYVT